MTDYIFADGLQDACKHCATLSLGNLTNLFKNGLAPTGADETATVTFVECEGRTYAVTANHVIQGFRKAAGADWFTRWIPFVPKAPGFVINLPFVQAPLTDVHWPDVAIAPIRTDLPGQIGKSPFVL